MRGGGGPRARAAATAPVPMDAPVTSASSASSAAGAASDSVSASLFRDVKYYLSGDVPLQVRFYCVFASDVCPMTLERTDNKAYDNTAPSVESNP